MTAQQRVAVIGGSGFVGRHLLVRLVNAGLQVNALARSSAAESRLRKLAGVRVVRVKLESDEALSACLAGQAVVINLVGILHESREIDFDAVHVAFPRRLAHLCQAAGVTQYLHMSALNADAAKGASRYLKSRGEGEDAVHHACGGVTVTSFRPSIILDQGIIFSVFLIGYSTGCQCFPWCVRKRDLHRSVLMMWSKHFIKCSKGVRILMASD